MKKDTDDINQDQDNVVDPKDEQIKTLEERFLRSVADYQNLQRRTNEERANFIAFASEGLLKKIVEVLDDLENCVAHIDDAGLRSIVEKLKKILKSEGVEEIKTEDASFEADLHEAIETVDGEKDKVIKTYRKGYKLNDKLLRPAMVSVGNGNKSSKS